MVYTNYMINEVKYGNELLVDDIKFKQLSAFMDWVTMEGFNGVNLQSVKYAIERKDELTNDEFSGLKHYLDSFAMLVAQL